MQHGTRSTQQGTSLIELLTGLAIVACLLGLGGPAGLEMLQSSHLSAISTEFLSDLHLARSEALKRNRRVTLCKSPDTLQCVDSGGWEQGWIVFHDENGNGRVDSGEELLARHPALPANLRLSGNQSVAAYISYTAVGATKLKGGGFQAGTLTVCRRSGVPTMARQVILNAIGRPRVQNATVATCV